MSLTGVVKLAAVVLNFRTPYDTVLAVRSLQSGCRAPDQIYVVDNASGDDSPAVFERLLTGCDLVQTGRNLGYSGGCNVGIRRALGEGADLVLLVNGDVMVGADTVQQLESALDETGVGIAGPVLLNRSDPTRIDGAGLSFNALTGRMLVRLAGRAYVEHVFRRAGRLAAVMGCVMLVDREVFDRGGLLVEDYFFSFEDLDFCLRAQKLGMRTVLVEKALAYHAGSLSIGPASPSRVYYATRNHLLLARRAAPLPWPLAVFRAKLILMFNLAHAVRGGWGGAGSGLRAWWRGAWHHLRRRYGAMP